MGKRKTTQQFIIESNQKHNNKYNYNETIYINNRSKVIIICPNHGSFFQQPANHINGMGCPKCGYYLSGIGKLDEIINDQKKMKTKLYLIKMTSIDEEFYKVGITSQEFKKRFRKADYYSCEVISFREMTIIEARNEELKFLEMFKSYKYSPKEYFQGYTECFSSDIYNVLFPKS